MVIFLAFYGTISSLHATKEYPCLKKQSKGFVLIAERIFLPKSTEFLADLPNIAVSRAEQELGRKNMGIPRTEAKALLTELILV